jgi:hypothetical protein
VDVSEGVGDSYHFQLNRKSKEAFAKERGGFLRFFAVFMFIFIGFFCVLLRVKELYVYLGAAIGMSTILYVFAMAVFIRGVNKEYRLTPVYVKVDGRHIAICYEHSSLQMSLDEIDSIAQVYIRIGYGISGRDVFRGHSKGEKFWLRYKYLEGYYLLKHYLKEEWIDKKDEHDFEFLKRESKAYERKGKRLRHISIQDITSLQLVKETIEPLYIKYNEWLLDYDREKMDGVFR